MPEKLVRAAFAKADAATIADGKPVTFMCKYPPALWKDKPGSAKLLGQCERAAKSWYDAAGGEKMSAHAKQDFARFPDGPGNR